MQNAFYWVRWIGDAYVLWMQYYRLAPSGDDTVSQRLPFASASKDQEVEVETTTSKQTNKGRQVATNKSSIGLKM
jgi:hypothetical protein